MPSRRSLAVASDWAHVLAASAWAGGLAFVLVALWRGGGDRWGIAGTCVPRFSALAVAAIALLLIAGVVAGLYEVGSWSGLWETTYGRLLLVKVALVVPILGLGVLNKRSRLRDCGMAPPRRPSGGGSSCRPAPSSSSRWRSWE